jgi:hypothetical protein
VPSKSPRLFHVTVDGKPIRTPTGADISSLGVGFFCGRTGPANLHVSGLRSNNGVAVHTELVTRHIPDGKVITVTYLESHTLPPPLDPKLMMENIDRMQREYEENYGPTIDIPPEQPSYTRIRAFNIKTPRTARRITARLDRDAQLQANVYWADGRCTLTVQSVFVASDGSSTGKRFIATKLKPRQRISLELLDTPPNLPRCSFCGKFKDEVSALISGNSAFICDECIAQAQRVLRRPTQ